MADCSLDWPDGVTCVAMTDDNLHRGTAVSVATMRLPFRLPPEVAHGGQHEVDTEQSDHGPRFGVSVAGDQPDIAEDPQCMAATDLLEHADADGPQDGDADYA